MNHAEQRERLRSRLVGAFEPRGAREQELIDWLCEPTRLGLDSLVAFATMVERARGIAPRQLDPEQAEHVRRAREHGWAEGGGPQ